MGGESGGHEASHGACPCAYRGVSDAFFHVRSSLTLSSPVHERAFSRALSRVPSDATPFSLAHVRISTHVPSDATLSSPVHVRISTHVPSDATLSSLAHVRISTHVPSGGTLSFLDVFRAFSRVTRPCSPFQHHQVPSSPPK